MTLSVFPDADLQRLLFHWPSVVACAPKGWATAFAMSIEAQSRRRGWRPSPKQREIMVRMVDELFREGAAEAVVIDEE